jgi:hypothetical protein
VPTFVQLVVFLLFALLAPAAATAGEASSADLGAEVPGLEHVIYFDLVRQLVPDLAAVGDGYEGHKVIDVRHIAGDEMKSTPAETVRPSRVDVLPVRSDGKDRLLLMLDLGQSEDAAQGYEILALFNIVGEPKLLDAAEVGSDQFTSFREPDRISLGEGKDLVLTQSSHFNSNQTYIDSALILIRNDSLQLVDSIFTFHDRACSFVRDEVLDVRAGDRDGRTYSDIVVTVTETTALADPICEGDQPPPPGTRTVSATYRWDAAASRFVPDSDAIEKLEQENMERL